MVSSQQLFCRALFGYFPFCVLHSYLHADRLFAPIDFRWHFSCAFIYIWYTQSPSNRNCIRGYVCRCVTFFSLVFCLFDDATQLQFTRSSQYTLPVQFYSFELAAYMPFGYLISVYMGKAPRIWIKPKGHRARIYSGRVVQRRPTSCNCSNSIWVHYNTNTHTFLYIPHIIRYVMCNINVNLVLVFTIQFHVVIHLCWYFSSFTINLACSIACTSKYCTDLCYLLVCSWMDLL